MKWIDKIAFYQNIRNETPNKELAKELCRLESTDGIKEIAGYLFDKNKSVASDCMAVLYHIGYEKPRLISNYLETFLRLLESKNNRMVWGAMIAIATISKIKFEEIFQHIDLVIKTMKSGTLITEVWGIKALAGISLADEQIKEAVMPTLAGYLEKARPIDFSTRLEDILPIVTTENDVNTITKIIRKKQKELSDVQVKKMKAVINRFHKEKKGSTVEIII